MNYWKIGLIFLLGLSLRLLFSFIQPLSFDELLTYEVLNIPKFSRLLTHILNRDLQMPSLYLGLLFLKKFLSENYLFHRVLFSTVSSTGIIFLYFAGKESSSRKVGLYSSLVFAISFSMILFGVEVRPYSILLTFSCLMTWVYCLRPAKSSLYLTILGLLACSFHYYGFLLLLTFLLIDSKNILKKINEKPLHTFIYLGLTSFLLLPFLPILTRNFNMNHLYRDKLTLISIFEEISNFVSFSFGGPIGAIILISVFIFFCARRVSKELNRRILSLIFLSLFPIMIVLIKSILSTPTLEPRYLIFFMPPFIVAFAIMIDSLERITSLKIGFLVLLIFSYDTLFYRKFFSPFREDGEKIYILAKETSEKRNLKLVSCGGCFNVYSTKNDNYLCYESLVDKSKLPQTGIVIVHGAERASCNRIFKNLKIIHDNPIYPYYVYGASR